MVVVFRQVGTVAWVSNKWQDTVWVSSTCTKHMPGYGLRASGLMFIHSAQCCIHICCGKWEGRVTICSVLPATLDKATIGVIGLNRKKGTAGWESLWGWFVVNNINDFLNACLTFLFSIMLVSQGKECVDSSSFRSCNGCWIDKDCLGTQKLVIRSEMHWAEKDESTILGKMKK